MISNTWKWGRNYWKLDKGILLNLSLFYYATNNFVNSSLKMKHISQNLNQTQQSWFRENHISTTKKMMIDVNETHLSETPQHTGSTKIESTYLSAIVILHIFIISLAIIGNSLVIYLVVSNLKLRNVRNAFMINLTLSNLLLATVCTPWFLITLIYPGLPLSNLWCKLSNSIPIVIILVSAFSIMMISIDRWMFVVYAR